MASEPTTLSDAPAPRPAIAAVPRLRTERRVLRRVDPWTVFRVSLAFYAALFVMVLTAGILLWLIASATGTVDNVEKVVRELFAYKKFDFLGGVILRTALLGGTVLVLVGTGLNVLGSVLYNLIADITGGVEITVADADLTPRSRV